MNNSKQLFFECECGVHSSNFTGLYQADTGELCVLWICDMCDKKCIAVVMAVDEPDVIAEPVFTEDDKAFLKRLGCYIKEEA